MLTRGHLALGSHRLAIALVVGGVLLAPSLSLSQSCSGDCNGDRQVSVDELIHGVSIALGTLGADTCPSFDGNRDQAVTVDELLSAVGMALSGCPW